MKAVITGGTGLIGSHLAEALRQRGDEVVIVSRSREGGGFIRWDPGDRESLDLPPGTDAVVHLAGAPIFGARWSEEYKRTIRRSRIEGTRTVLSAVRRQPGGVGSLVSGSAVGYYGDRGEEVLEETSRPGKDWLAGVCIEWEDCARSLADEHRRGAPSAVALLRSGIVLSDDGGALAEMLNPCCFVKPFHWGLGGKLGDGRHWMPWIHIRDEVGAILHIIDHRLSGPYNLTAPNPVRNEDFTGALGKVLGRPTIMRVPRLALKAMYGEGARVLLASQRALPTALHRSGYRFEFPEIQPALDDLVG